MAQITCEYHRDTPARWVCRNCHVRLCASCVTHRYPSAHPLCPVCGLELERLGAGNAVAPFWRRIPSFFAYPAKPSALLYMIALSVISIAAVLFPLGFLVELLVLIAFVKYGYLVLENTASGHLEPPMLNAGVLLGELVLPFKQVMLLFCLSFADFAIYDLLGRLASEVFYILVIVALPASTMVLAVEYSFFAALNPFTLGSMIRRIGLPYFVLFFFVSLLFIGGQETMAFLQKQLAPLIYVPLGNLALMYFSLAMFAMMGYVICQYHAGSRYGDAAESEEEGGAMAEPTNPALGEVEKLIKEDRFDEALQSLEAKLMATPGDLAARKRYHRLLVTIRDRPRLVAHCGEFISRLVEAHETFYATDVYADCLQFDSGCKPSNANHVHELAKLIARRNQPRLALMLLTNFQAACPHHKDVPRNCLLAAQIMAEKLNQEDNAKRLLAYLLRACPNHPLGPEIRYYLAVLERASAG